MTMEIINNFSSIYCFVAFVIGAVFMLAILSIAAMGKEKEPRNKVRFFVTKDSNYTNRLKLWLGKPEWSENVVSWISRSKYVNFICNDYHFEFYKLNPGDFSDMKVGEIREVFINLED